MDTQRFKDKLEAELATVETELTSVGKKAPSGDWEGKETELETMSPLQDSNEAADKIEELDINRGINDTLEIRYNEIKAALARIEDGSYGKCSECGMDIEEERLEANPAAKTCIAHA
jgi:DnaK suppressor protein